VLDVFEAMEVGTCMCLSLDVKRSEGCIADPSLLVIRDIIPTFMTAEGFLEQASFNLKTDPNAHGGFNTKG
jgi:hypothetical protein